MARQYRSNVKASIHETAEGLYGAALLDKKTMRAFDEGCLTPVRPLSGPEIRALRERGIARVFKALVLFHDSWFVQCSVIQGGTFSDHRMTMWAGPRRGSRTCPHIALNWPIHT